MTPSEVKATLSFSDGSPSVELPIYKGTVGPDVIDIRKLYGQTGKFTYDPGFMSTASCNSKITYIDGDKGELLYRGYAIDDLARSRRPVRMLRRWAGLLCGLRSLTSASSCSRRSIRASPTKRSPRHARGLRP